MSILYSVSVRAIENETTAVLDVKVVHPDSMYISPTPGFALMLLWEATDGDGPLSTETDLNTILDSDWMKKYAKGFVSKVEVVELENELPQAAQQDYDHDYWKHPDGWLRGALRVEVTDPAWLAHLSEADSWDSTAFESNRTFDACEPIRFEATVRPDAGAHVDPHAGLIPVPRVFFLDHLGTSDDDYIWFPKYSDKAYFADEVFEEEAVTEELIESMVGEVVWYETYGTGVGVLMPDNMIVKISSGSRGGIGFYAGSGKIGRARFNTAQKRLTSPLTISSLARTADPVVAEAKVDGSTVTLTVHCFETGRELDLNHAASALALIAAGENKTFDGFKDATSKLGTLLHRQAEERGISYTNNVFGQVAGGMIVEYTVAQTADAKPVDFDALEGEELIEALREDPWDTWSIQIVTTDAAWVEHLANATPFSYGFHHIEEPQPWTGEPLVCSDEHAASTSLAAHFPLAHQPSDRSMDLALIEELSGSGNALAGDEWTRLLEEHELFLKSGGAGGSWQTLSAAGLPLCIYRGRPGY